MKHKFIVELDFDELPRAVEVPTDAQREWCAMPVDVLLKNAVLYGVARRFIHNQAGGPRDTIDDLRPDILLNAIRVYREDEPVLVAGISFDRTPR